LTKHKMDSEKIVINDATTHIVNKAIEQKRKVCAVGTTVMRALESSVSTKGLLKPYDGWTNKFIFPPYEFSVPSAMITNFHLPMTTMLMTTSAFAGFDLLMDAYKVAIENEYRFGTYGDAMLIIP